VAVGDGDGGFGGSVDLVVSAAVAGVASMVGEPRTGQRGGRDYVRARE
jgi:hypothetical protein